eukprot:COSAG01_NODE_24279_length_784_cov_1.367883_1_plen_133_part_10
MSEICRQMRLPVANYRAHVRRVLNRLVHGKNVRQRDFQERPNAQKLAKVDVIVAADCVRSGFALRQAAANVTERRLQRLRQRAARNGFTPTQEQIDSCGVQPMTVRYALKKWGSDVHKRQTKKSGSADTNKNW